MNVFVDTNVLLDVLTQRAPFYQASAAVWTLVEQADVDGFVSAISFNNVYYIVRKAANKAKADKSLQIIRDLFTAVAPDTRILNQAIDSEMSDFEDAIQFHSAIRAKADYLLTRNADDFPKSALPILTPEEFMTVWSETHD